jgi:hypothetical protein
MKVRACHKQHKCEQEKGEQQSRGHHGEATTELTADPPPPGQRAALAQRPRTGGGGLHSYMGLRLTRKQEARAKKPKTSLPERRRAHHGLWLAVIYMCSSLPRSACVDDVVSSPLGFIFSEASPAALSFDLATCGASFFSSPAALSFDLACLRRVLCRCFFLLFLRSSLVAVAFVFAPPRPLVVLAGCPLPPA